MWLWQGDLRVRGKGSSCLERGGLEVMRRIVGVVG
jgi:hypothetical protein